MKLSVILSLFSIAYAADKLRIGILERPETCVVKARNGDTVEVHYTGKLEDGTVFDSSVSRQMPFTFTLGVKQVIDGWDKGILGMCPGEKRRLTIPPHLGYGDRGAGTIPPGATLIFDTQMISVNGVDASGNTNEDVDKAEL